MTLTCNFINTERNPTIEKFIKSLTQKTFGDNESINNLIVNIQVQDHQQVPWKCTIYLSHEADSLISAESQAANYLTAFSQALMRLKRQWDKTNQALRA